jgi:serine phosphatase RsbU (regulator of sigma subunit)
LEGWQIAPYYQPAREVGGDFYDFHLLPEGQLGLVVGDATGKGVPAALVMSTTCGMLQAVSQTLDSTSPGEVLERVNETLLTRIPPTCSPLTSTPSSTRGALA